MTSMILLLGKILMISQKGVYPTFLWEFLHKLYLEIALELLLIISPKTPDDSRRFLYKYLFLKDFTGVKSLISLIIHSKNYSRSSI